MRVPLLAWSTLLLPFVSAEIVRVGDQDIDVALPGLPAPQPDLQLSPRQGYSGPTGWLNGVEVMLPGPRDVAEPFAPQAVGKRAQARALLGHALNKKALAPGDLYGVSGMPNYTDAKQYPIVPSCGLTAGMQAIAYVLPELIKKNIIIGPDPNVVTVSMTDWKVTPLVKKSVTVNKQSLNSTSMMSGSVWWPGALEKGVEGLGSTTTYLLGSWAMTMVTGLEAVAQMTVTSGLPNTMTKDATWAELIKCKTTPMTVQTWAAKGRIMQNHVFTVLDANEVGGVRRLRLYNPHGFEDSVTYDEVWAQLYIISWLKGWPTRASLGLDQTRTGCPRRSR